MESPAIYMANARATVFFFDGLSPVDTPQKSFDDFHLVLNCVWLCTRGILPVPHVCAIIRKECRLDPMWFSDVTQRVFLFKKGAKDRRNCPLSSILLCAGSKNLAGCDKKKKVCVGPLGGLRERWDRWNPPSFKHCVAHIKILDAGLKVYIYILDGYSSLFYTPYNNILSGNTRGGERKEKLLYSSTSSSSPGAPTLPPGSLLLTDYSVIQKI